MLLVRHVDANVLIDMIGWVTISKNYLKLTSPFVMLMAKYISPNDPDPIFRTSLYFPPTMNSAFEPLLLAMSFTCLENSLTGVKWYNTIFAS